MATITAHHRASAPHPLDHQDKTPRLLWLLDIVFFAFAAVFVCLAPCGAWRNIVWGQRMWDNNDPSGPYVISSLFFFRQFGHPPFIGHPGVTLQAMIAIAAHAIHAVRSLAGDPQPFLEFWTRNIRWLFIVAGLIIAAMHVLSFHVLYAFARRLLGDAKPAFLAVLAYATLLPTLFYATRISVEPILVWTVLLSLLNLWRTLEAWDAGHRARAYRLICLAGATGAAALLTKIHLSFPLIPLCLLQLVLHKGGDGTGLWRRFTTRYKLAFCYITVAAAILTVGALSMDIPEFCRAWQNFSPDGNHKAIGDAEPTQSIDLERSFCIAAQVSLLRFKDYFTPHTIQYVFTISEAAFCVLAAIGLIAFWRARPDQRSLIAWLLAYGVLLLPVVGYRGYWYYLFLPLAVASAFFAFLLHAAVQRCLAGRIGPTPVYASSIILVLLIHSVSITFIFTSKCTDVRTYRSTYKSLYDAQARIHRGERVAVLMDRHMAIWKIHGSYEGWSRSAEEFRRIFGNLFVAFRGRRLPSDFVVANHVGAIVDTRQNPWCLKLLKRRSSRPAKPITLPATQSPSPKK